MPDPMRTSTSPSTSSAINASRTEGLDTPSCFARSRSGGNRAPAGNSPLLISGRIWSAVSRQKLVGDLPVKAARLDAMERHGRTPRAKCGQEPADEGVQGYLSHRNWSSGITNFDELHLESAFRLGHAPDRP